MDLLLIGASGFVSGTLARVALDAGWRVWGVTRGQRAIDPRVQPIIADRTDRSAFAAAIEKADMRWDLVVDVVGYKPGDAEQDVTVFHKRAKRLVFISTDFVADSARRTFPQREDNPHYATSGYGGEKRQCEEVFLGQRGDDATRAAARQLAWTIVRPCHIYGPGSQLGCLPEHGRDPQLIAKIKRGEPLRLVGGGHFLQQPILAADLAKLVLSCAGNDKAIGGIYQAAGPDIVESRQYYQIIADVLGVACNIEETSVSAHLREHPEHAPFMCHRIYDLSRMAADGLARPSTPLVKGLRQHVESLLQ
jgi:nucleoside-diphosphate-sugar epimerase